MHLRRLHVCVLCLLLVDWAAAATAQPGFFNGRHHHPPWDSPVASSQTIHVGGAAIQIDLAPGPLGLSRKQIVQWVDTAARAVTKYYGRFPVPRERVLIIPIPDKEGVLSGTTWGDVDGLPAFARMRVGQLTTAVDLASDWTMTHEFVHTALPSLASDHHWLEEGLATYVEPIARAQLDTLTPEQVWGEMLRDMHQGEPAPGDLGLDRTHTWASTYWGGALFCLLADIQIREKTNNRKGLQDGLRGILAAGGSIAVHWPVSKVLQTADHATGTHVLENLYRKMGQSSFPPVDLDAIWKRLGVLSVNGGVAFDDHAPLARIRQRILAGESSEDEQKK